MDLKITQQAVRPWGWVEEYEQVSESLENVQNVNPQVDR